LSESLNDNGKPREACGVFGLYSRELAGERRVTLILDRECWSPKSFKRWSEEGFDVLTYRKGSYSPWPHEGFAEHESRGFGKRSVVYQLAEQPLTLSSGLEVREVRCLTETGHQTSVVTTRMDLSTVEVAERMFSRWRQENFFRYMRHEFALDHLPTYTVEAADPERMVPNPAKKQKKKAIGTLRNEIRGLKQEYAELALSNSPDSRGRRQKLRRLVEEAEARLEQLREDYRALPTHVAVGQARDPQIVVQLEQERKILLDQIKMVAYRAETELANIVGPLLGYHHDDEARSFLRQVFQLPADIVPDPSEGILRVRLHGMSNWRSNRALAGLCQFLNGYDTRYPGTDLRLVLEPPASEH
jgi:hypothetical protein